MNAEGAVVVNDAQYWRERALRAESIVRAIGGVIYDEDSEAREGKRAESQRTNPRIMSVALDRDDMARFRQTQKMRGHWQRILQAHPPLVGSPEAELVPSVPVGFYSSRAYGRDADEGDGAHVSP